MASLRLTFLSTWYKITSSFLDRRWFYSHSLSHPAPSTLFVLSPSLHNIPLHPADSSSSVTTSKANHYCSFTIKKIFISVHCSNNIFYTLPFLELIIILHFLKLHQSMTHSGYITSLQDSYFSYHVALLFRLQPLQDLRKKPTIFVSVY